MLKIAKTAGMTALCAGVMCAAPFSLGSRSEGAVALFLNTAVAEIGRPLTPMSVAGVHRRAYRRAYYASGAQYNPYHRTGYGYGVYGSSSYYGYGQTTYQPSNYYRSEYDTYAPNTDAAAVTDQSVAYDVAPGYDEPGTTAGVASWSGVPYERFGGQSALYDAMPGYDAAGSTVWIPNPDRFGVESQR